MAVLQNNLTIRVKDLGLIDYDQAYNLQKQYVTELLEGEPQTLLLCEHPTVLTCGRLTDEKHLLMSKEELESRGIFVRPIDRGGDITLHTPGQLVIYPILNLVQYGKDLHLYMRTLEQVGIDLLDDFGIVGCRFSGQTGVWVGNNKIASIGIGVRKWVTFHGLAINVNTDLSLFSMINPCGLDVLMTSLSQASKEQINVEDVKEKVIERFCNNFNTLRM